MMQSTTKTVSVAGVRGLAVACLACTASQAVAAPKFPTPSGRVVYAMKTTGAAAMDGTIDMRWVNGGQKFRQDIGMNVKAQGRKVDVKTWTLFDGKSMYVSMPQLPGVPASARKTVMRMQLPPDYLEKMATGGGMVPGGGAKANAGKVVGKGTVLGKPCVVRLANVDTARGKGRVKMWMWNNLPLRTEVDMTAKGRGVSGPMRMTMVATRVDASTPASSSLFRVPAGATIRDMPAPR